LRIVASASLLIPAAALNRESTTSAISHGIAVPSTPDAGRFHSFKEKSGTTRQRRMPPSAAGSKTRGDESAHDLCNVTIR
jgi:hypothetical protein